MQGSTACHSQRLLDAGELAIRLQSADPSLIYTVKSLELWLRCALKDCVACPYNAESCPGEDLLAEAREWLR